MRIFIGTRYRRSHPRPYCRFMDGVRGFAPGRALVRPESLHITLKFIGETAPENVDQIERR